MPEATGTRATGTTSSTPPQGKRGRGPGRRRWIGCAVLGLLLAAALFALYLFIALRWSYSEGERAGYVQKFSHKGWVCKTWEGELAMVNLPGAMPEIFRFTVHDEAVAQVLNASLGERVSLHYEVHLGLPTSCFGDTRYFVTSARPVGP